ncbi:Proline--tRNA ligase [Sedimentisphaera cyanobacteriorum]|uniref:Proline--tRNA ligase n=1 Tax=Sedimentisphaera cyanobacteriorum TaxID=1940790 RepID=A0A1Q2HMZ0_9BACT|nr:proline--tRNA ligase [Sedimentisphaera cyanobacteriorum]AQQ08576.1 Proline--tRNA ligase [Sedimentisphaera cyanobacteriorum]
MRYSQTLIPTTREVPSDAEIPSHQLMIRAGLIRKIASGMYAYLPAGMKSLLKIEEIVREEMNRAGGCETLMPSVHPRELWVQTGRDEDYGDTMARFQDRHGRWNVLSPTAEEVYAYIGSNEISSYKQLPINMYQISFKFRDEFRPRFGVLRSREFLMKDGYSYHATPECLHKTYMKMYGAYKQIFERCGVPYVILEAEAGEMGGSGSHQFTVPCESGEDVIVYTEDSSYAANIEKAAIDPSEAAAERITDAPEEVHTPNAGSIEAVCQMLGTKPEQMIKSLIHSDREGRIIVAVLRGDHELNEEKLSQLLGGEKTEMASEEQIKEFTGASVGFAGPQGLCEKAHRVFIDHSAAAMPGGAVGANKDDYHVKNIVPGRDFPLEGENIQTADIRNAVEGDTHEGKKLLFRKGIEVGQVFKLGTKYSTKLECEFLDENGKRKPCLMGCYGIGLNRIMASAIETNYDDSGIKWPISIAPFEAVVVPIGKKDEAEAGEKLYSELKEKGIDVLLDDRNARPGVKLNDADLLGVPVRITVGRKSLAEGNVEMKLRSESENSLIKLEEAAGKAAELVEKLRSSL